MEDEEIASVVQGANAAIIAEAAPKEGGIIIPGTREAAGLRQGGVPIQGQGETPQDNEPKEDDILMTLRAEDDDDDDDEDERQVFSKEIPTDGVEVVQKRCLDIGYPVLEEYDFNNDKNNPTLDIDLKPGTKVCCFHALSFKATF